MFTDALLIALLAGIAGVDLFDGLTHLHRPIVIGPIVGLILGDVQTGLLVGGTLELVWMGMVPLAGAQPLMWLSAVLLALLLRFSPSLILKLLLALPFLFDCGARLHYPIIYALFTHDA